MNAHTHNGFVATLDKDGRCLFCNPARWEGGSEREARCDNCRAAFTTDNPRRRFCTSQCRQNHWARTTAKGAASAKMYADRQRQKRAA